MPNLKSSTNSGTGSQVKLRYLRNFLGAGSPLPTGISRPLKGHRVAQHNYVDHGFISDLKGFVMDLQGGVAGICNLLISP